MSASEIREFPYNEIFTNVARIFEQIGDEADQLVALSKLKELPEEQRQEADRMVLNIKILTRGVCEAVHALMLDIDDLKALQKFSTHANRLEELAEQAMILIDTLNPEQPVSQEWQDYCDAWVKAREAKDND